MPMFEALTIFAVTAVLFALTGRFVPRLRGDLVRPRFWLTLLSAASGLSATTVFIGKMRHAGTGWVTSYGWPKPFYFRNVSETGVGSAGFEPVYFAGNALAIAAALLVLWAIHRLLNP